MPGAYQEFRPAYRGEDYAITVAVAGSGSIAGWALAGELFDPGGAEIPDAVAVSVLDASARTVRVTVAGLDLAAGDHRLVVRRTDAGSRTVVLYGPLEVTDPRTP